MGFLTGKPPSGADYAELEAMLRAAQRGDREAREGLLAKYTPFVIKTVSRVTGRYVRMGQDDEASIGLIAFDEAISKYDGHKNQTFFAFAETVIKRRLIDYFRKENPGKVVIPFSQLGDERDSQEDPIEALTAREAVAHHRKATEIEERQEEIRAFNQALQEFGITFAELVDLSPKHEDARLRAMEVARLIAESEILRNHLERKKELPLKYIEEQVGISRKTLERQRKYIIALTLILVKDFTYLREYLQKSL